MISIVRWSSLLCCLVLEDGRGREGGNWVEGEENDTSEEKAPGEDDGEDRLEADRDQYGRQPKKCKQQKNRTRYRKKPRYSRRSTRGRRRCGRMVLVSFLEVDYKHGWAWCSLWNGNRHTGRRAYGIGVLEWVGLTRDGDTCVWSWGR